MELEPVEPRGDRPARGIDEVGLYPNQVGARRLVRHLRYSLDIWDRRCRYERPIALFQRLVRAFPAEARGSLAASMPELDRYAGVRLRVDDVRDARPATELQVVPETEAAGGDAGVRRDARHLREDHRGATEGPGAEMDEVEVVGQPVDRTVRRHGGDDDAVLERDATYGEWREHRRTRLIHAAARREPPFDPGDVSRITDLEIVVPDPLAPGQQAVRELLGFEVGVTLDLLEPLHAIAGRALELEGLDLAHILVPLERRRHVVLRDLPSVLGEHPGQRDGILHGELRARADAEVCCMCGVTDQHDVPVVPLLAEHAVECEPG